MNSCCVIVAYLIFSLCFQITTGGHRFDVYDPDQPLTRSFIVGGCDGGLANRLRVLGAFMFISKAVHQGSELFFEWEVNAACPGHFLQLFYPVPRVTFISKATRSLFEMHAVKVYNNSRDPFAITVQKNVDVPGVSDKGHFFYSHHETKMYKFFKPLPSIQRSATAYLATHNMCDAVSLHIRRTDLWAELFHQRRTAYHAFERFIDSYPPETKAYLMTDNPQTQQIFLDKYGNEKLLVYRNMSIERSVIDTAAIPVVTTDETGRPGVIQKVLLDENASLAIGVNLPSEFRFTSIEHTLVDVLLAAHGKEFRGSAFSSLTELVIFFRSNYRQSWC